MVTQPTHARLVTMVEAATEAGVTIEMVLNNIVNGEYHAYGRHLGLGLIRKIPPECFMLLPTSRLPPGMRYATEAEIRQYDQACSLMTNPWTPPNLPPGVVFSDFVDQEEDYAQAFLVTPRVIDTWFDAAASIIWVERKREWTDVRVERLAESTTFETPRRSGAAGRPTSKSLIQHEHERRIGTGEALNGLTIEATVLQNWLRNRYPQEVQMQVGTIETAIRDRHRQAGLTGRGAKPRN
jgi:hypothetical protein